jgi:hypothetical protein
MCKSVRRNGQNHIVGTHEMQWSWSAHRALVYERLSAYCPLNQRPAHTATCQIKLDPLRH